MGKNTNQVITFSDLNDMAYRTSSTSLECVTYGDLQALSNNDYPYYVRIDNLADKISSFTTGSSDGTKRCVTYNQLCSLNSYVPIYVQVTEKVTGECKASTINFYHDFGTGVLENAGSWTFGPFKDSVSSWVYVKLPNRYSSSAQLVVTCGSTSKAQTWKVTERWVYNWGTEWLYGSKNSTKSVALYYDMWLLHNLTGLKFYID